MTVYADLSEFLSSPIRTGIQRVTGELVRSWPASYHLKPARVVRGVGLVELPHETVAMIREWFDQPDAENSALQRKLSDINRSAEADPRPVHLGRHDRILAPELFYNPDRVAFYRSLDASILRRTYFVVYDFLPLTHPHLFVADAPHEIICGYFSLLRRIPNLTFISDYSRDVYSQRFLKAKLTNAPVFPLGADGLGERPERPPQPRLPARFTMLGTLEPRKNHEVALDAIEPLLEVDRNLELCFIGKAGWISEHVLSRIVSLAARNPRFRWERACDDGAVRSMIMGSRATLFLSEAEGYGLPPTESLWLGVPVVCSRHIPSVAGLDCVGASLLDRVDAELVRDAVLKMLDESTYRQLVSQILARRLPTWAEFSASVAAWASE